MAVTLLSFFGCLVWVGSEWAGDGGNKLLAIALPLGRVIHPPFIMDALSLRC